MKLAAIILSTAAFVGLLAFAILFINSATVRECTYNHFTHDYAVTMVEDSRPYEIEFTRSYWHPFTFHRHESFHASHPVRNSHRSHR